MKNSTRIQLLVAMILIVGLLSGCSAGVYEAPIDSGVGSGWFQWIVTQIALFTVWISEITGGYYFVGLIIVTLIVRTAGWPIYAKSNAMTVKMQQAQPELEKVKEKYQGKTDETSQRKMQAETVEIYRKYKINPLGCLLPFLQMPIFISMYQVVRRIPLTPEFDLNYNFLWTDLGPGGKDPLYILPILVGILMFLYQRYSMKKPEYLQNKKYKTQQANQSEKTMKMMSYFMVVMLVSIAWTSASIALYWIVGNAYQFLQTYINRTMNKRKMDAEKSVV
jgi:YidC/Oxa1 family membrane protein insertase